VLPNFLARISRPCQSQANSFRLLSASWYICRDWRLEPIGLVCHAEWLYRLNQFLYSCRGAGPRQEEGLNWKWDFPPLRNPISLFRTSFPFLLPLRKPPRDSLLHQNLSLSGPRKFPSTIISVSDRPASLVTQVEQSFHETSAWERPTQNRPLGVLRRRHLDLRIHSTSIFSCGVSFPSPGIQLGPHIRRADDDPEVEAKRRRLQQQDVPVSCFLRTRLQDMLQWSICLVSSLLLYWLNVYCTGPLHV